ncbi:hypothetical protein JHK82_043085 [Glycine max]|nr:hypothetical protein JHK87_043031 [Glycine soja]KAG5106115.1 hypothetical protein JHK82_043085 [Glycine max]
MLTRKYELFSIEENKDIQCMFGHFQTILNELRSLGRTYDNYDHIDKILRSLSRKWSSQVTMLRALKNLDSMYLEELLAILKFHEQELQQDEGLKREKSITLNKQVLRSSSKALNVNDSSDDESKEDSDEDELVFIFHKNLKRLRNKNKKDKDKSSIVCYKCKKLGHFKFEYLDLEKSHDRKKFFKTKEKKGIVSTWEDLDDNSSDEDNEEANICLMADTTLNQTKKMRSQKSVSFLNNEFLKNEELEGQPQDVVNGTDNLNKLLGYCRSSSDKSGNGYDGKVYVHDEDTIICYFCGKTRLITSKCRDHP